MKITPKEITLQSIDKPLHYEKDFEFDESLPEHFPNINEVLFVEATISKNDSTSEGERASIESLLNYKIYYTSDPDGELYVYRFSKKVTQGINQKSNDGTVHIYSTSLQPSSCRLLNQRKLFIKTKIALDLLIVNSNSYLSIPDNQEKCYVKTHSLSSSQFNDILSDSFIFEDEISLGDGYEPIDSIVDIGATVSNYEYEMISGYVNLKGNVSVSVLYRSELDKSRTIRVERQLFFEKSIPSSNVEDCCDHVGKILIENIEAFPKIDSYGEYRCLNIKYNLNTHLIGINENYVGVVTDIFSPNKNEHITKGNAVYSKFHNMQEKSFLLDGIISTSDITLSRIISSKADVFVSDITHGKIKGTLQINILGESNEGIKNISFKKDFEEELSEYDLFLGIANTDCSVSFTGGNNLSYKVSCKATSIQVSTETIDMITNVEFTDITSGQESLIIYYPSSDEAIWDISKKYHISPETLKKHNTSLDGERSTDNEIVVIKYK